MRARSGRWKEERRNTDRSRGRPSIPGLCCKVFSCPWEAEISLHSERQQDKNRTEQNKIVLSSGCPTGKTRMGVGAVELQSAVPDLWLFDYCGYYLPIPLLQPCGWLRRTSALVISSSAAFAARKRGGNNKPLFAWLKSASISRFLPPPPCRVSQCCRVLYALLTRSSSEPRADLSQPSDPHVEIPMPMPIPLPPPACTSCSVEASTEDQQHRPPACIPTRTSHASRGTCLLPSCPCCPCLVTEQSTHAPSCSTVGISPCPPSPSSERGWWLHRA